jgi:hypothetical protein
MTLPNRSKKSPTPKVDISLAPRDLTPSEIESLRKDAQESLEEMRRLDEEEEYQKASVPPQRGVDGSCEPSLTDEQLAEKERLFRRVPTLFPDDGPGEYNAKGKSTKPDSKS